MGSFFWRSTAAAEEETFCACKYEYMVEKRKSRFTATDPAIDGFHRNELQQSNIKERLLPHAYVLAQAIYYMFRMSKLDEERQRIHLGRKSSHVPSAYFLMTSCSAFTCDNSSPPARPLFSSMCVVCVRVTCVSFVVICIHGKPANPNSHRRN